MEKGPLPSEWGTQERAAEYEMHKELEETEIISSGKLAAFPAMFPILGRE